MIKSSPDVQMALDEFNKINSTKFWWAALDIQFIPFRYIRLKTGVILSDGQREQAIATYDFSIREGLVIRSVNVHS